MSSQIAIEFGAPKVNVDTLRGHKEKVIANHVEVEETTGTSQEKTGGKNG